MVIRLLYSHYICGEAKNAFGRTPTTDSWSIVTEVSQATYTISSELSYRACIPSHLIKHKCEKMILPSAVVQPNGYRTK